MRFKLSISILLAFTFFMAIGQKDDREWEVSLQFKKIIHADYFTVAIDNQENVVVTGFFSDTLKIYDEIYLSKGTLDVFLAKFDNSGKVLWIKQAGGTNVDFSKFINTDNQDNIYVQGLYKGKANIGGITLNSNGSYDYFTAKFNQAGDLIWVKTNHEVRVKRILKYNT